MTTHEFMETPKYKDIIKRIERLYMMYYFPKSIVVNGSVVYGWTNQNVEKQVEQLRELLNYEMGVQCGKYEIGEKL